MPKRPLSAYNIFFRQERQALLGEETAKEHVITDQSRRKHRKTHGKVGFAEMAKIVGNKWKSLDTTTKQAFEQQAELEKARYFEEREAWNKLQEEDTTQEPTETTEAMEEEAILRQVTLRDDEGQTDTGTQASTQIEARLPQFETAHYPAIFRGAEDYTNDPRSRSAEKYTNDPRSRGAEEYTTDPRSRGRAPYMPMMIASLPQTFGSNDPSSVARGRASLPGNLPSRYGDNPPYTMVRGRASLPGDPSNAFQVPPRTHASSLEGGFWSTEETRPGYGFVSGALYSQAQDLENERARRQMEEMMRMHLTEAALLREQLGQRTDQGTVMDQFRQQLGQRTDQGTAMNQLRQQLGQRTDQGTAMNQLRQQLGQRTDQGTAMDQLRQQLGQRTDQGTAMDQLRQQVAFPDLLQARRASTTVGDMRAMERAREANRAEILANERAQAARRAEMVAVQRALDNERALREEEELRKRRSM
jgi:hypothetical protein